MFDVCEQDPPMCLTACNGSLHQWRGKNTEELRADKKGVKNKCEKLDHGTWCLEVKQDFSGKL